MSRNILICVLSLLAFSCNEPNVIVVDGSGSPIEGASVEPVSLSLNYASVTTDKNGKVYVKDGAQPVKWINVSKVGYLNTENIDFTQAKPIKVVLSK